MPTKIEKDSVTGRETTGHEWDGIKELNTPLPKWWLYVFYACIAWAIGMFILYPSIPYGTGYFKGVLGYSQRRAVDAAVAEVAAQRQASMDKIAALSFADIRKDPALLEVALTDGRITFATNCQPCHGAGGAGRPGYPALAAGAWIWGGTLEDIQQTITHGIRSADPDARQSAMPRFGADGILKPDQIQAVADFVHAKFYGHPPLAADIAEGQKIFAENCAACHGDAGQGNPQMGAPRLASKVHLYGGSLETIVSQVTNPRMGVMPNWNTRLDPATIKALALYVHSLGGGQ
ncbi:MAG: cytochrome-c oxidase, cbb3-type subunit III [Proteobacteria bacterium]|nr:cytochrome-c oxidase, cbb3-type subunit III [Pseudomonadota bacterium]